MPKKTTEKALRKPHSMVRKALGAAVVSAAMLGSAGAVGLGQLTVMSALGQPLQAEIELTSVSREEAGNLSVRLASQQAFRQANIEFNPALGSLRFSIEQRGNRQVVKITSAQPINEPFVDMLLEVSSNGDRLLREYVALLDPVGMRRAQPAETAAANASASPAPARTQTETRSAAAPAPQPAAEKSAGGDTYPVKRGDTLAAIAGQVKPEGVSLDQMLVALQRANPNAFAGNNINRLRTGQILAVPNAETARSISNNEAHRIVIAQSADFNSYRNRLASQVAAAGAGQGEDNRQLASGKIGSRVEEQQNPAAESRDRLQVSRSGAPGGADAEERIAQEKALAEANSRVRELEKTVGDLQRLLEIRNRDLAARQNQAAAVNTPAAAGTAPATAPQPMSGTAAADTGSASPAPVATPAATPPVAVAPASSTSDPAAAPAQAGTAKPAKTKPRPAPVAPPPEPSLMEDLTSSPAVLGGSALLLALLAALGIGRARKAKAAKMAASPSIMPTSTLKTNSLFGATGGQSVDTSNSVFNSNFSPSASQLDTNEVDPVAEADVYIAYGRDAQAEEILKEALRTQPDRAAVRGKLLEIYAARKDLRAFEATATELFSLTKGEGEEWTQAATLGLELDPGNPLYASARKPADTPADMPAATPAMASAATAGAAMATASAAVDRDDEPANGLDFDALLNTTQNLPEVRADVGHAEPSPGRMEAPAQPVEAAAPAPFLPAADAPAAPPASEPEPVEAPQPEASSNLLDFDFDLDSFGKGAPPPAPAVDAASADSRLMDFNLDSMDLPALHQPAAPSASEGDEDEFPPLELDVPGNPAVPAAATAVVDGHAPMDFDLSSISLDLDPRAEEDAALQHADVPTLGEHSYSSTAEMATKLDLASAYQEIGDHEGARELLEEVIKGGDNEQSEKAKVLLEKLA
jgi:pilus assembly protein FimV